MLSRSRGSAGGNGGQGKGGLGQVDVPSVWQGWYQVHEDNYDEDGWARDYDKVDYDEEESDNDDITARMAVVKGKFMCLLWDKNWMITGMMRMMLTRTTIWSNVHLAHPPAFGAWSLVTMELNQNRFIQFQGQNCGKEPCWKPPFVQVKSMHI